MNTTSIDKVPRIARMGGKSRKGSPNKRTAEIKEMILEALNGVGGVDYLMRCAENPKTAAAFLGLVGKVLPLQLTGDDCGPVSISVHFD